MTTTTTTTTDYTDLFAGDVANVTATYRDADVSTKAAMRAAVRAHIDVAIRNLDPNEALRLATVRDAMTAAPKQSVTVDYVARVADHRAALVAAIAAIDAGEMHLPDGVTIPDDADLSDGTPDPQLVRRFATVSGRKSGRGNVAAWIDAHLGDEPMTIAALRAAHTPTDDYPTAAPSTGAIGACLDRDGAAEYDIEVTDIDGKKGAVRA